MLPYSQTILLAEDDPDDEECFRDGFAANGFSGELKSVHNGVNLLEALKAREALFYSLIVIDNVLPDAGACHLLTLLKSIAHCQEIPVVVVSGYCTPGLAAQLEAAGAAACLQKPASVSGWQLLTQKLLGLATDRDTDGSRLIS